MGILILYGSNVDEIILTFYGSNVVEIHSILEADTVSAVIEVLYHQ